MWDSDTGAEARPRVHGLQLQCAAGRGGGALGCFLEPLSSCSVADLTWEELAQVWERGSESAPDLSDPGALSRAQVGRNGYDDTARVRVQVRSAMGCAGKRRA